MQAQANYRANDIKRIKRVKRHFKP